MKLYHTSWNEIDRLGQRPLWFALELEHATEGWAKTDPTKLGWVYEGTFAGELANEQDPAVQMLFSDYNIDIEEYVLALLANPTETEIMSEPGSYLLQLMGYDAFQYTDYDPRDFSKDLPSILVFSPQDSISGFSLIH